MARTILRGTETDAAIQVKLLRVLQSRTFQRVELVGDDHLYLAAGGQRLHFG